MKKKILTISSICALALFMVGCKNKDKTKDSKTTATPTTVKPTTVKPTTAKPTTTESIEKYKVDETTFNSFFQYDFDGLKDVNFEGEDIIKREGREDEVTTLIVADGRVNTPKWNTIYTVYQVDDDNYGMRAYMKNDSGEYAYVSSWAGCVFKEICVEWFLPLLDYSKMTFDESKRCYVSSEVITYSSVTSSGSNSSTISEIEVKFYNNKPTSFSYKEIHTQTGDGFDPFTETAYRTVTYKSFGSSTVVNPSPDA